MLKNTFDPDDPIRFVWSEGFIILIRIGALKATTDKEAALIIVMNL